MVITEWSEMNWSQVIDPRCILQNNKEKHEIKRTAGESWRLAFSLGISRIPIIFSMLQAIINRKNIRLDIPLTRLKKSLVF